MRKPAVVIFVLVLIVVVYITLIRPASINSPEKDDLSPSAEKAPAGNSLENATSSRPKWTKPTRTGEVADEAPENKPIVYGPAEFARGELQNIVIDGGIRLGDNASFVPRFNPKYQLFGNFISPEEELQNPFDSANINFQVAALNNNEVIFEIRTRDKDGVWSEWREVSAQAMKEPVSFGSKAVAWQFRVALFANDSASSPKVEAVSIQPLAQN